MGNKTGVISDSCPSSLLINDDAYCEKIILREEYIMKRVYYEESILREEYITRRLYYEKLMKEYIIM